MGASRWNGRLMVAAIAALALAMTGCGSDKKKSTTKPKASSTTSTTTRPEFAPALAELCNLAWDMAEQESFPTAQQLERYQELAPAEIAPAVSAAAQPLIAVADQGVVAQFNAFAVDEVEAAVVEINAWETENCEVEHDDDSPGEGATRELEPDATRVDVKMLEYEFDFAEPVAAGRTSFVGTNAGAQAHFMALLKLADGVSLEDVMASEDGTGIEGEWSSHAAASGGADEEVLTVTLEPGTYALACFVPDADGEPHVAKGMTKEFTVS